MRIILALLVASCYAFVETAGAQVGYDQFIKEKQWYRPNTLKDAYTLRNRNQQAMIKIANRMRSKVEPSFTLTKWENINFKDAAYCKIWLDSLMGADLRVNTDSSFTINDKHRLYMKSETEFEWEIILWERPKTNTWTYIIETENIAAYYQDSTTDVPGAYVIYHTYKKHNFRIINGVDTTRENYTTGKVGIFRCPTAWDATDDTILLNQVIDIAGGSMTIFADSADSVWLSKATLPITIGPTFGIEDIGGTNDYKPELGDCLGHRDAHSYTASTGDNADSLYIYGKVNNGTADIAIYNYGVILEDRQHAAVTVTFGGAAAWQVAAIDVALTNGTVYVLAIGNNDESALLYYDNLGSISRDVADDLPATWSHDNTVAEAISSYCVYTTVGVATAAQFINIGGQ